MGRKVRRVNNTGTDMMASMEVEKKNGKWKAVRRSKAVKRLESERDYGRYAILADYSNKPLYCGFRVGETYTSVSKPKDLLYHIGHMSRRTWKRVREISAAQMSEATFLTLKELKDFDWKRIVKRRAIISVEEYAERKRSGYNGRPKEAYAVAYGTRITTVNTTEADRLIERGVDVSDHYLEIEWQATHGEIANVEFLIGEMEKRAPKGDSERIRIVIWFW